MWQPASDLYGQVQRMLGLIQSTDMATKPTQQIPKKTLPFHKVRLAEASQIKSDGAHYYSIVG